MTMSDNKWCVRFQSEICLRECLRHALHQLWVELPPPTLAVNSASSPTRGWRSTLHNMPSSDTVWRGRTSPLPVQCQQHQVETQGIQPHLGMSGQQMSLCSPSSSSLISLSSGAPLCVASKPTPIMLCCNAYHKALR